MAPRFRPPRPTGPVVSPYDARRDRADDPVRLAYLISKEAASALVAAHKNRMLSHHGYIARHLCEKGLLKRNEGKKATYRLTLRGEAVVENLGKRFPDLFPK